MSDKCEQCGAELDPMACCGEPVRSQNRHEIGSFSCLLRQLAQRDARISELEAIVAKAADCLVEARKDIIDTARANQANINGVDIVCPDDPPCLSRIGTFFVHQDGIDASLRVAAKALRVSGLCYSSIHDAAEKAKEAGQ